jgi:hypothetical protein
MESGTGSGTESGTESGTGQRYVRCRRCHGVFEAGLPNCSRCGAAFIVSPDTAEAHAGSYAERYTGTEFDVPPVAPSADPLPRRSGVGLLLALGVALIATTVGLGALVVMGAFDTPVTRPTPGIVVARTPTPSPVPTLPPMITQTLQQLSDPNLNVHVSIRTTLSINARVTGRSSSSILNSEIDCANGNESGTKQSGNILSEFRLVDGVYYVRQPPAGVWHAQVGITPFIVLSPLFALSEPRMLQYDGPEQKLGVATEKLESTAWWTPDSSKVSGLDVAALSISPQHTKLQLWVASDGSPLYATFRAWTDASDSTNLLDITTTYTFTNEGTVGPIASPTHK